MPTSSYHDEPPPGIHGCWYCINLIADRLLARLCSVDDVICNLEEALRRGLLRSKVQSCADHRLVDPSEWAALQLVLRDSADAWLIEVVHRETGEPLQANLYIWLPDYDRLWSTEIPTQRAPEAAASAAARPRRGRTEYDVWPAMFDHLDSVVRKRGKRFDTFTAAAWEGLNFIKRLAKTRHEEGKGTPEPTHQTIREKISDERPDLVRG